MVVGVGEQHGGVYCLNLVAPTKNICHVHGTDTYQLWHYWLDHPTRLLISSLAIVGDNNSQVIPCDIYFKAKQTHEFFFL